MSRSLLRVGLILAAVLLTSASTAVAATQATPVAQASGSAGFGSPPSGPIPILYNDHHVYAKPDLLKHGRVLAAYARGGTLLLPLRSMFEEMGGTVAYDPSSRTATVSKPGSTIVVTIGKPEVVINGESRPLDVPPMLYHGMVLVPVRVISETMGAYVQWVPDRRLVVVRYLPATPPPTEAPAPPPVPEETLAPSAPAPPTPNPLTVGGYFRSYYFTRQNASNNPGTQFNYAPGAKYNANGVNQASWGNALALHADWTFPDSGWIVGGTYLYANSPSGECVVPANNLKTGPCNSQVPPNTNQDETLPPFALATFDEAYLKYVKYGWNGTLGNQLFNSPWANPADSRLKPASYEGGDLGYTTPGGLTIEGADMLAYENRTSSTFSRNTLLTGYPSGGGGLPSNILVNSAYGINTNGFAYGHLGFAPSPADSANLYFYNVADIENIWWGQGKFAIASGPWTPYIALQGGTEQNAGQSVIGKIDSQDFGAQLGFTPTRNLLVTAGYDNIPWHMDAVNLPAGVTCGNSNYQISVKANFAYFLPSNAAQCYTNRNGMTQIEYGGWASPYTDSYATDPLFTTSISQGMADRRAPGSSEKLALTFTSTNKKFVFMASKAWYNYGNALAAETTNEWNLDGMYRFSRIEKGPYHGLSLRDRYMQRTLSNTYCGAAATECPAGSTLGSTYLGGLPLFKYNRVQLEYDF